jgi:hypothetical protein
MMRRALLVLLVMLCLPAAGWAQCHCRHFCRGSLDLGLGFGFGHSDGESSFNFSGRLGYFVLDGLDVGVSGLYQTNPAFAMPEGFVEWHPFTAAETSPFVVFKAGRLFGLESGLPDATIVSGGAGLVQFLSSNLGFYVAVLYSKVFSDVYTGGWNVNGGLAFYSTGRYPSRKLAESRA